MLTAKQLYKNIISKISKIYSQHEASSIAFLLMEKMGVNKHDYVLDVNCEINDSQLIKIIQRLLLKEPIQYILEEAWFYGRSFKVNKDVLIPRQETEQLCKYIIDNNSFSNTKNNILDIGSGSGCISITLSKEITNSEVVSIDISETALVLAKENASRLKAKVEFLRADILTDFIDFSKFQIVVSNPPYVLESEKHLMHDNVLKYEPHLALFVEDSDPLIFYKKIIKKCSENKVPQLYLEINEKYGQEVRELLINNGFKKVEVKKDLQMKDRIVSGFFNS